MNGDFASSEGRNETDKERLDRNLNELLGGLRVALPGVQVLFAFLLAVPFNQRFSMVTGFERAVYFVTLLLTAATSALMIAPSAYHRIQFRRDDKAHVVFVANRLMIAGFFFLALAMTGVVLLVTAFLFGLAAAIPTALVVGGGMFSLWYLVPLRRRAYRTRVRIEANGDELDAHGGGDDARAANGRQAAGVHS